MRKKTLASTSLSSRSGAKPRSVPKRHRTTTDFGRETNGHPDGSRSVSTRTVEKRRSTRAVRSDKGKPRGSARTVARKLEHGTLQTVKEASRNLLDVLGGRERVIELLADAYHPKAQRLIDRLRATDYIGEDFATSIAAADMKLPDIVQIFSDSSQGRVMIEAMAELSDVMRSLIRAAKDQIEEHEKCNGGGWVLDKRGRPTDTRCRSCKGSGYVLKSGARDAQELYFTLLKMKQSGMALNIDQRRQQVFVGGGGSSNTGLLPGLRPGEAPDVLRVIKRADEVRALPPPDSAASMDTVPNNKVELMPEEVLEAETV